MSQYVAPAIGLVGTLGGLANFAVADDAYKLGGISAVAAAAHYVAGELLWRTKEARQTMTTRSTTSSPTAAGNAKVRDRLSTLLCGLALSLNQVISNIVLWKRGAPAEATTKWRVAGLALILAAAAVRRTAMLTLGSRFTMALATLEKHRLVTSGIYRVVRHPGYLANLLSMTGYSLAVLGDYRALLASGLAWFVVWGLVRIPLEERMMEEDEELGAEYKKYKNVTRARVIPFLF